MNHKKYITELLQACIKASGETDEQKQLFWGYMSGWIPEQIAAETLKEKGLEISGREIYLYNKSYFELRDDKQTEYLEDRELNKRLSELVLDSIENKDEFKNQSELNNEIKGFLDEIIKSVEQYEILFRIQNLDAKLEEITFWDCKIAKYDKQALVEWGFRKEDYSFLIMKYFENQNVIVVKEEGNKVTEIVKRARIKANRRLRALQSYLKEGYIHDFQLLFEVSKEYAVRKENTANIITMGFDNKNSPVKYDYTNFLIENSGKANTDYTLIKNFPPPVQDLLERTLYWIGLSISEIEMDLKIAFLCTALETLLTTKDDKRKGEKIAYRGYLLGIEINPAGFYFQPQKVLQVYELRSTIVHGSRFGITTDKDYRTMLKFAQQTFSNFINFANKHNLNKQSKIYKKLLQSEHLIPLMTWLDEFFNDKPSKSILESINEDWFKKN